MDKMADGGVVWRRHIRYDLRDLGIHWLDPCNKPCRLGVENDETRALRHKKKAGGDWQFLANEMYPIRRVDIRMVDISDFLIVFLDLANSGFGTIAELTRANSQQKPIIVMQEGGKQHAPDWLFGMLPESMIFGDWGDLYYYLKCIDECCYIKTEQRWLFFDWQGTQEKKPEPSYNFAEQCRHPAFSIRGVQSSRHPFDAKGFYDTRLGEPWPENLK